MRISDSASPVFEIFLIVMGYKGEGKHPDCLHLSDFAFTIISS